MSVKRLVSFLGLRRRSGIPFPAALAATVFLLVVAARAQDEDGASGGGAYGSGPAAQAGQTDQDYEVLRRLLGVEKPPPPAPEPEPEEAAPPIVTLPASVEAPAPVEAAKPAPAPTVRPVAPKKKATVAKPVPKTSPQSKPKPVVVQKPKAAAPEAKAAEPAAEPTVAAQPPAAPVAVKADLPEPGSVLTAADIERWKHLLGPSVQWTLQRGAKIAVAATQPIPIEAARAAATERYHDQVTLTDDGTDIRNFVAGMPFPIVSDDDPHAAIKVMFNQQARVVVDDVDVRKTHCDTGRISDGSGFTVEKTYVIGHWRRLFYTGRLYHDPKPVWPTQDGVRYREIQHPFIEPFDLKSAGLSYTRHIDSARPDNAWLYYPLTRRVRRMSTAQRSQGQFGQDVDADSYTGFAGNPAWTEWKLLGTKTVLAPMHAKNIPVKWQQAPADFLFEEAWEPREVYVIAGRSRSSEYAFSTRVLYVDRESHLVTYVEIYDLKGALWKGFLQAWAFRGVTRPEAPGMTFDEFYLPGYTMIDMQGDHATRCQLPSPDPSVKDKGWFYNYGEREGTTEAVFDVSSFISEAH